MAGLTQSIGSHSFLSLEGDLQMWRNELEAMVLPYRNGEALRSKGYRSKPFVLRSCVDLASETAAYNKAIDYCGLIGAGVQTLTWRSVDLSSEPSVDYKINVIDLTNVRVVKAHNIVGGLNVSTGSNGVMLYCDWAVLMVPN